jgi:CspA family cold shock protein
VLSGTVKWYSEQRGYGFISPDDGGSDVFVHRSALPRGQTALPQGTRVSFELRQGKKGLEAGNVTELPR